MRQWVKRYSDSGFQTLAEVDAIDGADLCLVDLYPPATEPIVCYVRSARASFRLDRDSSATPDGITVVAALNGGRWLRELAGDSRWEEQVTWYYDAAGGSLDGAGTADDPISSIAELARRLSGSTALTEVTLRVVGGASNLTDAEAEALAALTDGARPWVVEDV